MEDIKNEEKIYTQEDVNNITNKVRAKYEEKYVSKEDFNNLQKQLQEKEMSIKASEIKSEFLKNGGIENAFNDFLESNKSLYSADNVSEELNKIKEKKHYFFTKENIIPNETQIMKDLFKSGYEEDWNYLKVKVNKS